MTDRQTDRQTDGRTDILPRHSPRYTYASRGKIQINCGFLRHRVFIHSFNQSFYLPPYLKLIQLTADKIKFSLDLSFAVTRRLSAYTDIVRSQLQQAIVFSAAAAAAAAVSQSVCYPAPAPDYWNKGGHGQFWGAHGVAWSASL